MQSTHVDTRSSTRLTTSLCILLWALASLATALAQTPPRIGGRMTEPLEKYEMPPAPPGLYRLESSPRMISQYGLFTSYQVNVDANGNNIVGDAANELSICLDGRNRARTANRWEQHKPTHFTLRQAGGADHNRP